MALLTSSSGAAAFQVRGGGSAKPSLLVFRSILFSCFSFSYRWRMWLLISPARARRRTATSGENRSLPLPIRSMPFETRSEAALRSVAERLSSSLSTQEALVERKLEADLGSQMSCPNDFYTRTGERAADDLMCRPCVANIYGLYVSVCRAGEPGACGMKTTILLVSSLSSRLCQVQTGSSFPRRGGTSA